MGKFIQRVSSDDGYVVQTVNSVFVAPIEVPKLEVMPATIYQTVERIVEIPVEKIVTIEKQIIQYIDREVQVIKEVPVEVICYVNKEIEVIKEKFIEVPFETIKEVEKRIVQTVHKIPNWVLMALALETLALVLAIVK